ncbi:CDP-glycerol glycerophosphotransferase family protein [Lactiplantibacillus daowaiensis]|uniref:CDP-glycerol glycerophosphotransferase family protein n=1 Tax=Lactiplantibacillus daowaiensis TaxID=2559918 RepID=A0ABW1S2C9_9LACO|nr:CDP-glycerol glycerophosphotransferase family protein [Lactiplantibacillus daowaiensis]
MASIKHRLIMAIKILIRGGLIVLNDGFILLPVKKHSFVFESFNGNDINDNPMALYQALLRQHPEYADRCYFNVKPKQYTVLHAKYPEMQLLKRFHLKWIWVMARAEFWVFNSRMPRWWRKNDQTTYVQTWHGTPLKHLGLDIADVEIPGTDTQTYHQKFLDEAQRWDYLIAPNQYSHDIFTHAFGFSNQWLDTGYPRNDRLYTTTTEEIATLKQQLLGRQPANVILYAPTWRDDDFQYVGRYNFKLPFDLATFFDHVAADTILVLRPHYLVKDHIDIRGFEDRVKILAETDITNLYLISDLMITDYSSVMFDFANLKRPQLFYAYDLEHYRDQLRGFYFDYEAELPGPLVTTDTALYQALDAYTAGQWQPTSATAAFYDQFCRWEDGHASEKVLKQIGIEG